MEAKKIFLAAFIVACCVLSSQAQTLYVPSGTAGIGSSATGNVGIGVSSPQANLHLASAGSTYIRIEKASSSLEGGFQFNSGSTTKFYFFSDNIDNDALKIEAAGLTGEDDSHPRMMFPSDNKNLYMALSGGNVGIGTTSPQSLLDLRGNITMENGPYPVIYTGTGSTELNRYLLLINSNGYGTASGLKAGGILVADSYVYANPGKNDLIVKGNVGIGTPSPDYALTVKGSIHAKEVRVDLTGALSVPDYVFEKDYKLTSLEDIKTYIDQNKHLPEVPSAKEIEKNGVQLGEMNLILLKKIEELTLHAIEQNKTIEEMKKEINDLKAKK